MKDEPQLRDELRQLVIQSDNASRKVQETVQALQASEIAMHKLIAQRDLLARLFLPEGMTLQEAWTDNYEGLRSDEASD